MKLIDGKIVMELRDCTPCSGRGVTAKRVTCPRCRGTRRGPRGGRNGCRCLDGTVYSDTLTVTCSVCNGSKKEMETRYDSIPHEIWSALNFRIVRDPKGRWGFNESYLGLGYVMSVTDYGTAWERNNDAELLEKIKADKGYLQALNICDENLTVCKEIVVMVTPNGYKGKAVYGDENPKDNSQANALVSALFDKRQLAVAEMYVAAELR